MQQCFSGEKKCHKNTKTPKLTQSRTYMNYKMNQCITVLISVFYNARETLANKYLIILEQIKSA